MKVLFIEPPKDPWFLMGQYQPPPLGILELAAYIEAKNENISIRVLDCQAERVGWKGVEEYIDSSPRHGHPKFSSNLQRLSSS